MVASRKLASYSSFAILALCAIGLGGCPEVPSGGGDDEVGPLKVVTTVPAPAAVDVSAAGAVLAVFNEELNTGSIDVDTFTLTNVGTSAAVAGTVSALTNAAYFQPSAPLTAGATYRATVTKDVSGTDAPPLETDYSWTFTVSAGGVVADTTQPFVTTVTPADSAVEVPLNFNVKVNFNEALKPASVTATTVKLQNIYGTDLSVTRTYGGTSVNLRPGAGVVTPDTEYVVVVTTGVQDMAGNALLSETRSRFKTGHRAWQTRLDYDAYTPEPFAFATGFDNWVWMLYRGSTSLSAKFMDVLNENLAPYQGIEQVDSVTAPAEIEDGFIAADNMGSAMVVYRKSTAAAPSTYKIYARYYRESAGAWDPVTLVSELAGSPSHLRVAFDSNGNANVVWAQVNAGSLTIQGRRFSPTTGWATAAALPNGAPAAFTVNDIKLSAAGDGSMIAAVHSFNISTLENRINTTRHTGSGWVSGAVATTRTGSVKSFDVAGDLAGNYFVAMSQAQSTSVFNIFLDVFRYTKSTNTWAFSASLDNWADNSDSNDVRLLMDRDGNATVLSIHNDVVPAGAPRNNGIFTYSYGGPSTGTPGWNGNEHRLTTIEKSSVSSLKAGIATSGHMLAMWTDRTNNEWGHKIISAHYVPGYGWSQPMAVEDHTPAAVQSTDMIVTPAGCAFAKWFSSFPTSTSGRYYRVFR